MTESSPRDASLHQLHAALECLSWPAERQLRHLKSLQVGVDELALEFDDAFRLVRGKVAEGRLPKFVVEVTQSIDNTLERMTTTGGEIWTAEALANSPEWANVRALSSHALDAVKPLVS